MKAVFFDFDGTLTYDCPNIWKSIWRELGYSIEKGSEYRRQLDAFLTNEITYQEWCEQTLKCYLTRKMNRETLNKVSKNVVLIKGANETFKKLKEKGYSLHIVSGNIVSVIKTVLAENIEFFDSINANDFIFDENDKLISINGTEYDFEGKARFIQEFKQKYKVNPEELYFVGNSFNDESVHLSGCNTICLNPKNTDIKDKTKWQIVLENVNDLREILKYIK